MPTGADDYGDYIRGASDIISRPFISHDSFLYLAHLPDASFHITNALIYTGELRCATTIEIGLLYEINITQDKRGGLRTHIEPTDIYVNAI